MVWARISVGLAELAQSMAMKDPNEKIKGNERRYYRDKLISLARQMPVDTPPWLEKGLDAAIYHLDRESTTFTYNELRTKLIEFGSFLPNRDIEARTVVNNYGEALERRIRELEAELEELRSNPALEKKVSQIEEQVRKIRVASVAITEDSEKEQENMLRQYKTAKKKVFVIMPFAPVFDDAWHGGIKRACDTEDVGYLRVDKISLSSWITEDIKNYLSMADFVIVDTTGNNPNVMFEFGWALALKKRPIVIRQKDDPNPLPFDVKDIRHISYQTNWSGIENLYSEICKFLRTTSETSEDTEEKKKSK